MIELGRLPGRSRVAEFACLREITADVVRVAGGVEILQVTANACRHRQVVVVVDVAVGALAGRYSVSSGQYEAAQRMVESRRLPGDSRVTVLAGGHENFRVLRMIRVGCAVVIVEVASDARGAGEVVVVVLMAVVTSARRVGMASSQNEAGQ